jgi:three-Cys-motif partner protein
MSRGDHGVGDRSSAPTLFDAAPFFAAKAVVNPELAAPLTRRAKALAMFFQEQKAHSAVKTTIVMKYFPLWLQIISRRRPNQKLAYIDLFAGPGIYDDGTESTPILVAKHILSQEALRATVLMLFTEKKAKYFRALQRNIAAIPGIERLKYKPYILRQSADDSAIPDYYESRSIVPTFMFLDPFGYSGISLRLIGAVLKDWACEVMLFWNFNRINSAIRNNKVRANMDALFGSTRVDQLRMDLKGVSSEELREGIILEALRSALDEVKGRYMQVFRFRNEAGRLTHHLVFVTKSLLGQRLVKDIMAKESSSCDLDGVSSFEFRTGPPPPLPTLSLLDGQGSATAMQGLQNDLLAAFRGQSLTVEAIYEQHNYGTPFILKNYQEALRRLFYDEAKVSLGKGLTVVSPTSLAKRAMSPKYVVVFDKIL